ncbi:MAG: LamG domain-containing protein [Planctomycetota bacterium]
MVPSTHAGLVSHYTFDAESQAGRVFRDTAGRASGVVKPDMKSGPRLDSANVAVGDGSLKLDGVDDRLVIRPSNRLSSLAGRTKALTVSAWIKPMSGGSTNNRGIIGALEHGSDKQANQLFMLQLVGNDLRGVVYTDAGFFVAGGNAPIEMDGPDFIHVAYTWDGVQLVRYINGQAVQDDIDNPKLTTGATVLRWRNGADEISIGASQPKGNAFFKGNIDDLAVFDHALSSEDIKGLAEKTLTPTTVPDPAAEVTTAAADVASGLQAD